MLYLMCCAVLYCTVLYCAVLYCTVQAFLVRCWDTRLLLWDCGQLFRTLPHMTTGIWQSAAGSRSLRNGGWEALLVHYVCFARRRVYVQLEHALTYMCLGCSQHAVHALTLLGSD
jgi:hypothetical protein